MPGLHFRLGSHCAEQDQPPGGRSRRCRENRRARFAVAERDVAIFVHRDRRQPAIVGIRIVGARLEKRRRCRRASGVPEFEPCYSSVIGVAARIRTADHERLVRGGLRALVAISQAVHVVPANVVEIVQSDAAGEGCGTQARAGDVSAADTRRVSDARYDCCLVLQRSLELGPMSLPLEMNRYVREAEVRTEEKLRFASRRRSQTVEIGRKKSEFRSEILLCMRAEAQRSFSAARRHKRGPGRMRSVAQPAVRPG